MVEVDRFSKYARKELKMLPESNLTDLVNLINEVKTYRSLNEANTSSHIIIPFLYALNWNIHSCSELEHQYTIENGIIDLALKIDGIVKVLIEIKKMDENISKWEHQIRKYAIDRNIYLFILTNGIRWQFYTWLKQGIGFHNFITLDINIDDKIYIAKILYNLLSKERIASDVSRNYISTMVITHSGSSLYSAIEEVWYQMLEEPSPLLCKLVADNVHNSFQISAKAIDVEKIIKDYNHELKKIRGCITPKDKDQQKYPVIEKLRNLILKLYKKKGGDQVVPIREIMPYVFRQMKSSEVNEGLKVLCSIGFCELVGRKIKILDEKAGE